MKGYFLIGVVGVDSGQLLIADPCYIDSEWKRGIDFDKGKDKEFSYGGCCKATVSEEGYGQLNYKRGHVGVGVAFSSGYGDGCYQVWGKKNKEGRIIEVKIIMG